MLFFFFRVVDYYSRIYREKKRRVYVNLFFYRKVRTPKRRTVLTSIRRTRAEPGCALDEMAGVERSETVKAERRDTRPFSRARARSAISQKLDVNAAKRIS